MEETETYKINHLFSFVNEGETFATSVETIGVEEGKRLFWTLSGDGLTTLDIYEGYLSGSGLIDS